MSFPASFEELRRAVVAHEIELIVIDPMMAFFKPEVAANSDQVMRVALAPLAVLAARSGASVLLVRQLTKHGGRKVLYRGGGSISIIGAIRTALFLGRCSREPDRRILAMTKSNIGPTAARPWPAGWRRTRVRRGCNGSASATRRPTSCVGSPPPSRGRIGPRRTNGCWQCWQMGRGRRRKFRKRRGRRGIASGRWSGPSAASASSPGVCGRKAGPSGNGPNGPCRTAPVGADEGKADRPHRRAASALRPWPAGCQSSGDCRTAEPASLSLV